MLFLVVLAVFAAQTLAVRRYRGGPVNTTKICGSNDTVSSGDYTLINNIWGDDLPAGGFQCSAIDARQDNNSIEWTLSYGWPAGKGRVKGFANMQQNLGVGHRIGNILSMPTRWNFSITDPKIYDLTFNLAYDMFTATSANLSEPYKNEIMIWQTVQYMLPVSAVDPQTGKAKPIATNLTIGNYNWTLYGGFSGRRRINVYSFVNQKKRPNSTVPVAFAVDIVPFFQDLVGRGYISSQDYLNVASAGSEIIKCDNSTIKTTFFSLDINSGNILPSSSSLSATNPSSTTVSTKTATSTSQSVTNQTSSTISTSATISTSQSATNQSSSTISTKITSVTTTSSATLSSSTTSTRTSTSSSGQNTGLPAKWSLAAACVQDNASPNNLLPSSYLYFTKLTIPVCINKCNSTGTIYAGVEAGSICYCGNQFNTAGGSGVAIDPSKCRTPCGADNTTFCGGSNALTLYRKAT